MTEKQPSGAASLLRRHAGRKLASWRGKVQLTQEQVADSLERGVATVQRMEAGDKRVRFRRVDVGLLADMYKLSDKERAWLLWATAAVNDAPTKLWYSDYTDPALPTWFSLYVELEDAAETIREYEPEAVPGLLQTRAYVRELMRVPAGLVEPEEVERRIEVRVERQSLLSRPRAPHLDAILNEAVVRRMVGGPEVMAEQLDHLLNIGKHHPGVTLRILPFSSGVHAAMNGAFAMLNFPMDAVTAEPLEPPLVYLDGQAGALYLDKPGQVRAYELTWDDLLQRALDAASSQELIKATMEAL